MSLRYFAHTASPDVPELPVVRFRQSRRAFAVPAAEGLVKQMLWGYTRSDVRRVRRVRLGQGRSMTCFFQPTLKRQYEFCIASVGSRVWVGLRIFSQITSSAYADDADP
jgi:hypothetical protein